MNCRIKQEYFVRRCSSGYEGFSVEPYNLKNPEKTVYLHFNKK